MGFSVFTFVETVFPYFSMSSFANLSAASGLGVKDRAVRVSGFLRFFEARRER